MLVKGFYYSEAMVKDDEYGYISYRLYYRYGKVRVAYDWNESGVYESKDGDIIRKEKADRLVKEEAIKTYYYRAFVATDYSIIERDFVDEEAAKLFVKEEVEKLFMKGEYNITTKVEKE